MIASICSFDIALHNHTIRNIHNNRIISITLRITVFHTVSLLPIICPLLPKSVTNNE